MYTLLYKRLSANAAGLYADGVMLKSVLRARIRVSGSGAFLTPGSGTQ